MKVSPYVRQTKSFTQFTWKRNNYWTALKTPDLLFITFVETDFYMTTLLAMELA